MDQLLREILDQPEVLRGLIERETANIEEIARLVRDRDIDTVVIAARGSSDNAATYAKYLFGARQRLPVVLAAPSLCTLYEAPPRLKNSLVLAISQSGMSPDIVAVVQEARRQGMLTVAITNEAESRLTAAAECVIQCQAGEERSVAATKTYTAELLVLALLSTALAGDPADRAAIERVPRAVRETITLNEDALAMRAERYCYVQDSVVTGRGYNLGTALEIALKLKELTYIGANPYSSADLMHGPIAVIGSRFPVVVVAPNGRVFPDTMNLLAELCRREAELLVISDCPEALAYARTSMPLPAGVPEWLSPLTAVVPGQLLAYHLALAKGLDPTRPRGLHKVTETR